MAEQTEYIVLEFVVVGEGDSRGWAEFAQETAASGSAAIRAALEGNTDGGMFVAVPARSWKPVKVTAKTETTLRFEDAK